MSARLNTLAVGLGLGGIVLALLEAVEAVGLPEPWSGLLQLVCLVAALWWQRSHPESPARRRRTTSAAPPQPAQPQPGLGPRHPLSITTRPWGTLALSAAAGVLMACGGAQVSPPEHVASAVEYSTRDDVPALLTVRSCWAWQSWLVCETTDVHLDEGVPIQACLLVRQLRDATGGLEVCTDDLSLSSSTAPDVGQ